MSRIRLAIWSIVPSPSRGPAAPLIAIDRAQFAIRVGPFVPDGDAMLLQPMHIGLAAQEPEQLIDDGFQVHFLGGDQGKAVGQIEAHLMAEDGARAGAGAVALFHALVAGQPAADRDIAASGNSSRIRCLRMAGVSGPVPASAGVLPQTSVFHATNIPTASWDRPGCCDSKALTMRTRRHIRRIGVQHAARRPERGQGNGLMIAAVIVIHPAHRFIIAADQARHDLCGIQLRTIAHQPQGGGKMGGMGPFRSRQSAGEQSLPDRGQFRLRWRKRLSWPGVAFQAIESQAVPALQFLTRNTYIQGVGLSDYGDKRLCNKRPGPGGGTRRLHHKLISEDGFLWGRNRIDGRVKTVLLPGMVPPLSG